MACINQLSANIDFSCDDRPKGGVVANGTAVIINYNDIDFGASTLDGATITALTLKDGATGYSLEYFKELISHNSAFTPNTEDVDGFTQSFLGRISVPSADSAERAQELANGRFVVVYESNYKGVDQLDAFKVLGWETGLQMTESTINTLENSSSILFTLATQEGRPEKYPYQVFLETDYETTKSTVEALFVPTP